MGKVGRLLRESLVTVVKDGVADNSATFLVSCSAVSAATMDNFRKDLKHAGARVFVPRNRLARIAFKGLKQEEFGRLISGQVALIWSKGDCVQVSKAIAKFAKGCEGVKIRAAIWDGNVLGAADVKRLAELPPREVLLAQLLQVLASPVSRLAGALNGKTRELLSILKQLSEKKGGS